METDLYILPKQLWSSPTLLTRMASLMKEEFMLKYEIQKGTRLTQQNINYWHFPYVWLCT